MVHPSLGIFHLGPVSSEWREGGKEGGEKGRDLGGPEGLLLSEGLELVDVGQEQLRLASEEHSWHRSGVKEESVGRGHVPSLGDGSLLVV
jgi:hypothetical protein